MCKLLCKVGVSGLRKGVLNQTTMRRLVLVTDERLELASVACVNPDRSKKHSVSAGVCRSSGSYDGLEKYMDGTEIWGLTLGAVAGPMLL